jgi:malate dehydrogenase (oxaloacetate-decarboxylating)(NADP+)
MADEKNAKYHAALKYHAKGRPGKIEVTSTKPTLTSNDLSLAYSPGVASPCLEISKNPDDVYKYTTKGNLVGVISNGSAVLGLGNIGALAGKPVMEGKGVLFKRFADIDVFDIEIDEPTVEGMVSVIEKLEPTFGGINLEDIKAPECFEIEKQLVEKMNIPVFHDDQHGTAIIASAGFLNALEISGKNIEDVIMVFSGAGAASIACAQLFIDLGAKKEHLFMCDSKGVIYQGREKGMNKYKEMFAVKTDKRTLGDAMVNADVFIGCSAKGVLTKDMVKSMAKNPIIFAMANPEPEILPEEVAEVRDDAIMATGRSDYPNQVNNVLGFPFIFRGALDVRARKINSEMKMAAVRALAELAKEEVPEEVKLAYDSENFSFGPEYIIPKPFDTRALTRIAPAVAKAAMESGVARIEIPDLQEYANSLDDRLGTSGALMKSLRDRLSTWVKRQGPVKMVFAEGANTRILQAVSHLFDEGKVEPILLGSKTQVHEKMSSLGLDRLKELPIITPAKSENFQKYVSLLSERKERDGISHYHAEDMMAQENYFGAKMVQQSEADAFIAGPTLSYPDCFVPIMKVIGTEKHKKAAGIFLMVFKDRVLFLADCTAQINPSAEDLVEIAASAAELYHSLMKKEPRVSFLSFSNFGSNAHPEAKKVKKAVQIAKEKYPKMECEGEMQADVAVNKRILDKLFGFNELSGPTDILVFPDLTSANISYKLLQQLSDADAIGPVLVPLAGTANIIQRTASVSEIVNMCNLTALLSIVDKFKRQRGMKNG